MQTCLEEHHSYCINGLCAFHSELRKPICKCLAGYNGERCEHLTLNSYAHNSYERYIAVGIGIGILTSGILAIIYCYVRKRCRKLKSPYKVCMGETALWSPGIEMLTSASVNKRQFCLEGNSTQSSSAPASLMGWNKGNDRVRAWMELLQNWWAPFASEERLTVFRQGC